MKRRSFFLGLSGLAGCTRATRPRLNVFNWSDYVAPDTISNFEREHNVEVRYSTYESNEEMLAKVFGGNSGWDVVFPANYFIQPMRENQLLARLRPEWLKNVEHLESSLRAPKWDPRLEWSIPYMWGAAGIVFQKKVTPPLQAWSDLWSDRLRGRMTMLDDPADCIGAAMKYLGYSLNTTSPEHYSRARAELLRQKPLLRAYLNAEARDQLVAGDLLASQLWATTSQQAMDAPAELAFVYPEEGFSLYCDSAVILRESRRLELAHLFLNYLLRPEVAANVVLSVKTATANGSAREKLPPELRESGVLYPTQQVLARGEWVEPLPPDAQRMRDRIWTEIKSG